MSDDLQRRRIGIREIAEEAGLSKTAVSYALNGTGRLDPATRARVVEIAKRLGYRANPNARNLRRRSFGVIAMSTSLPSEMSQALMSMDYFMRVWQGAMSAALERGYMLLFTPFGAEPRILGNMPIDGGIVVDPVSGDRMVAHLEGSGLPVVLLGRDSERPDEDCWIVDSPHGELAGEIFAHFQAQGQNASASSRPRRAMRSASRRARPTSPGARRTARSPRSSRSRVRPPRARAMRPRGNCWSRQIRPTRSMRPWTVLRRAPYWPPTTSEYRCRATS